MSQIEGETTDVLNGENNGTSRSRKRLEVITGAAQEYHNDDIIYGDHSIHLPEHGPFLDKALNQHFQISNILTSSGSSGFVSDIKESLSCARKAFSENYSETLDSYVKRLSVVPSSSTHVLNFSNEADLFLEHCDQIEAALYSSKNSEDFKIRFGYVSLMNMLNVHDQNTYHHSRRVAQVMEKWMCIQIDQGLMTPSEALIMTYGGLFHDVGKIGTPSEVLNKEGKYTQEEKNLIKDHTDYGAALVCFIGPTIENIARYHHEMPNGKGYKLGLHDATIPKEALMTAIVDSVDAMIDASRRYKIPMTLGQALRELKECSGKQFSKKYVDMFISGVSQEKITFESDDRYVIGQYINDRFSNVASFRRSA